MTFDQLANSSLIAVYSAIVVYVLAFVIFALDLSSRSSSAVARRGLTVSHAGESLTRLETESVDSVGNGTTVAVKVIEKPALPAPPSDSRTRLGRVGTALVAIAWILHVAGAVLRGLANGYVPWSNMFEFALIGTAVMSGLFLALNARRAIEYLGTFITGIVAVVLGGATVNFYVAVTPLAVPLQSTWLVVHVFVATLGTGFFAIGAGLSIMQILRSRHETAGRLRINFLDTVPTAERLESFAYRVITVGFIFWTFTLIAGAIWASNAWGRYWGWDTKEVWTFIIWTIFAGYIHARATRGWRGTRSAWLAIIGFSTVLFNFTVVNLFFKGLHSYSGIPGVGGP